MHVKLTSTPNLKRGELVYFSADLGLALRYRRLALLQRYVRHRLPAVSQQGRITAISIINQPIESTGCATAASDVAHAVRCQNELSTELRRYVHGHCMLHRLLEVCLRGSGRYVLAL